MTVAATAAERAATQAPTTATVTAKEQKKAAQAKAQVNAEKSAQAKAEKVAQRAEKAAQAKAEKGARKGETVKAGEEKGANLKGAIALFDGKTTEGWQTVGNAHWTVEDGLLVGRQGPNGAAGDLLTKKDFDNFDLAVTYKVNWPANTGVWFRYQNPNLAYQADVLEYKKPEAYSGSIYAPGVPEIFLAANLDKSIEKKNDWNTMRIRAAGDVLSVWLNGQLTANVTNNRSATGKIGFQVHPSSPADDFKNMAVMVKSIQLRPLKAGEGEKPVKGEKVKAVEDEKKVKAVEGEKKIKKEAPKP
jgi:hypothetical protein